MEFFSEPLFLFLVVFPLGALLSFWLGRFYERRHWMPGRGLHLIGVGGNIGVRDAGLVWVVRHDSEVPDLRSRDLKKWSELSAKQRDRALRRDGPPNSTRQARKFLYEVREEDGVITGSVGPTEDSDRYSFSFDRQGGYAP